MELPSGGALRQAMVPRGWLFICLTMLSIALELALENRVYEDLHQNFSNTLSVLPMRLMYLVEQDCGTRGWFLLRPA